MDKATMQTLESHSFKILITVVMAVTAVFWNISSHNTEVSQENRTSIEVDNEREKFDRERFIKIESTQAETMRVVKTIADKLPESFPPPVTTMQIQNNAQQINEQARVFDARMGNVENKIDSLDERVDSGQSAILKAIERTKDN